MNKKRLLIIDDDSRNIFALEHTLRAKSFDCLSCLSAEEALKLLSTDEHVDAVLIDMMMPEMDGYEAMRQIRLNKKTLKLPIIALTAKAMKNDREKCIEAGANDYISKPVDIDKLLSMLRVWLS